MDLLEKGQEEGIWVPLSRDPVGVGFSALNPYFLSRGFAGVALSWLNLVY